MKKLLILLGLALASPALTSCESFLDKNTDPNSPTETTPNFLLPSIISNGLAIQYGSEQRVAFFTQNVAARGAGAGGADQYFLTNANSSATFNNTYFLVGGNIPPMIKLAQDEGSPYYVGAGKIMMALILSHATDMLGDIPYREAFQGEKNFTPAYDPQEQLYGDIQQLLDEGIVEMSKPASDNKRPFYITTPAISGDILYRGDVQKWIRLAWSLKARQANHLTKKGAKYEPKKVLEYASKGFLTSADDCILQFVPTVNSGTPTTNYFSAGAGRLNFSTSTFGANFIKFLNGATYPGVVDPRLPVMATATSPGADPGVGGGPQPTTTPTDFYRSFYTRELGYMDVITYHELQFIKAEAAFLDGQKSVALAAYREGIRAHMAKIGVGGTTTPLSPDVPAAIPTITTAQINTYLASSAVAQTEADLSTSAAPNVPRAIMQQKYIAMFLNPESWTDMRRYDFSPVIYPNLVFPVGANSDAGGKFPRRLLPATTEVQYNSANLRAQVGPDGINGLNSKFFTQKVWWDQ
ncbi:SusD/RagB family nutrient-binding outer membrane lipoprotein [Hymenobacter monticola]|uniref:SusD/RagB family nutrient-binding outer membrane lipoprotein n=1 Tax=Hymenobacter monticola TaxID=1705399 RepID=A0ABY4B3V1_9BACT|nr:SusD/RagB family nutrient-binding outer membrane lipoprotein [Hymenobacter monticola]UOE33817.1 SusD/RagB family nutrient-binding outer membrane lipoprotein [Hymenobacter monticola]